MRIGLLTTSFPRFEGDVAGCFVLGFARALARRGHQVEVLAPEPARGTAPRFEGLSLRWVPYARPRRLQRTFYGAGAPDNLRRDPGAWLGALPFTAALAAHAAGPRRRPWDAVVSHWALPCGLVGGAVAAGRPHVAVLHGGDLDLLHRLPGRARLARAVSDGATRLLFVSEAAQERFLSLLPADGRDVRARCLVQPMGVEPPQAPAEPRSQLRAQLGLDRFTLLFLGRLVPIKGLTAALQTLRGRADLTLLLAGAGPERSRLEALASETGLDVRFVGTVAGVEKERLFHAADALLLPSRVEPDGRCEGTPTVLLEAMARGLPVLSTPHGGAGELLRGGGGLLFDDADPASLHAAVDGLRCDPGRAAALSARARARAEGHSWPALGPRLEALLQEPAAG
ncbi:MAG: glycosyltransferase family 4 protein [Myxococcales bacterium]|jgi:glycosyltransferase involved in cell wall biosynthesis